MGAQLSLLAQTSPSIAISSYIDVLDDVHYVSQLNSSRFLKTCKAVDPNGEIIIKVFIKPTDNYSLKMIYEKVNIQTLKLAPLPNVSNYSKIIDSDRAGYLIRQHLRTNLYDRISSRPFLQVIELKFMIFQLLQILKDIHSEGITHGDIKTENIMVTSWNWLILSDFSSYIKPVHIPDDNPGEFSFYFDTSQRRSCYLAPERFDSRKYTGNSNIEVPTVKMDIFSAGCCITELFTEGKSIFNLSQLFKYKNGDYSPHTFLNHEIKDSVLRELILDMINLNPSQRLASHEILAKYRGTFFPEYFYTFAYEYFKNIAILNGQPNKSDKTFVTTMLSDRSQDIDKVILKMYKDFLKICASLEYPLVKRSKNEKTSGFCLSNNSNIHLPLLGKIKLKSFYHEVQSVKEESALLFVSILLSAIRNLISSNNKMKCLELIILLSQYISDNNKLDRLIPYITSIFFDESPNVQAFSLQALSQILLLINNVSSINSTIFSNYILPRIRKLLQDCRNNPYVRIVIASTLGDFAVSALRFHEISVSLRHVHSDNIESLELSKKIKRKLIKQFEDITIVLLTDNSLCVKNALLDNILPVCRIFGREKTNDIILSHLITYLNDSNSSLRISLIKSITGIAILLGPITLEQYILPLLIQTITDSEELVVVNVLQSLKNLCRVGLIKTKYFFDIANTVSVLLLHPNVWIRQFSLNLIIQMSSQLSKAEVYCVMYPILRPYFGNDMDLTWESMLSSCKKPVSRPIYNMLCTWSLNSFKTLFWKQILTKNVDSFGNNHIEFITKDYSMKHYGFVGNLKPIETSSFSAGDNEVLLTMEDKDWIDKMQSIGLYESEIWKIAALRGYVFRSTKLLMRKPKNSDFDHNEENKYLQLDSVPQKNVSFDLKIADKNENLVLHAVLKDKNPNILQFTSYETSQQLPKLTNLNGSLILSTKKLPTTTSTLENVYVKLEPSNNHLQSSNDNISNGFYKSKFTIENSYDDNLSTVNQFLNTFDIRPALKEYTEFGKVNDVFESNSSTKITSTSYNKKILCQIVENKTSSIVKVAMPSSGNYFISGSDQGILKVWDFSAILSGETYSSRLSLDVGSSIIDMKFLSGYDVVAVSTIGGLVLLIRVLFTSQNHIFNFSRLEVIRKFELEKTSEYALTLNISQDDTNPYLIFTTNFSSIMILDMRDMSLLNVFHSNIEHGVILSSVLSSDGTWMVLGTSKGILDLWDLRFGISVRSWTFGSHDPITYLNTYPSLSKKNERNIIVCGGCKNSIISLWDITKMQCKEVVVKKNSKLIIEDYFPVQTGLSKLSFNDEFEGSIDDIFIEGFKIFMVDSHTREIFLLNFRNRSQNQFVVCEESFNATFNTMAVTPGMNVTIIHNTTETSHKIHNLNLHCDTVNSLILCRNFNNTILISADNSGIINLYL